MELSWKGKHLSLLSDLSQSSFSDNDDETTDFIPAPHRVARPSRYGHWATILNTLMFVISVTLFSVWFYQEHLVLNPALRRTSSYSPIHDHLDLEPRIQKVNGTLFPPKEPSIARVFPNAVADETWAEWELRRIYPVTSSELLRMGSDPSTAVKLEDAHWGLGDDVYAASWDVYHQLHCLNMLRKMAYNEYYNMSLPRSSPEKPSKSEIHLNHCVDMLVQALHCSGNVNLITMRWVETQRYPFPDFSIQRQCVNFEAMTKWRKEKSIDMDKWVEVMQKPEGVKQLPMADAYYDLFEQFDNPNHANGANPGEDFNI